MSVDSKSKSERRQLHFESYQDILDDARHLAAVRTRTLGNWSLGQICDHLAKAMTMSVDGATFKVAWPLRIIGPLIKNRVISRPMKPGIRLPRSAAPLLPPEVSTADGLASLEKAIGRLVNCKDTKAHMIFGPMSPEEWHRLHMRHSEMHLSFVLPE